MLKLRLLNGPREGRQLRVNDTKPVSIGRRKGRLRLHDTRVSKNHAEIRFEGGMWLLKDLGSSNGTFLNQERVDTEEMELESGDLIQMGRVLVKVLRADEIGMDAAPWEEDGGEESGVTLSPDVMPASDASEDSGLDLLATPAEAVTADALEDSDEIEDVDDAVAAWMADHEDQVNEVDVEDQQADADDDDADLISLEEPAPKPEQAPARPGTTALPALQEQEEAQAEVSETGSVVDELQAEPELQSEISTDAEDDADTPDLDLIDEIEIEGDRDSIKAELEEGDDEAEDSAPGLVGLALGQAPPDQPDDAESSAEFVDVDGDGLEEPEEANASKVDEIATEVIDQPAIERTPESADALEPDVASETVIEPKPEAAEIADAHEPIAAVVDSDEPEQAFDEEPAVDFDMDADFDWGTEVEATSDEIESLDAGPASADLEPQATDEVDTSADDEPFDFDSSGSADVVEIADVFGEDMAEGSASTSAVALQEEVESDASLEDEPEPEATEQSDVAEQALEPLAEVAEVDAQDEVEAEVEDVPEAQAESESEPEQEHEPASPPIAAAENNTEQAFDIDAAFDALSAGLDDEPTPTKSEASPNHSDHEDDSKPDLKSIFDPPPPAVSPKPDSELSNSQLDIGFIQDALARLGNVEGPGPNPEDEADRRSSRSD